MYKILNNKKEVDGAFNIDIAGADLICMAVLGLVYYVLIFLVENLKSRGAIDKLFSKADSETGEP